MRTYCLKVSNYASYGGIRDIGEFGCAWRFNMEAWWFFLPKVLRHIIPSWFHDKGTRLCHPLPRRSWVMLAIEACGVIEVMDDVLWVFFFWNGYSTLWTPWTIMIDCILWKAECSLWAIDLVALLVQKFGLYILTCNCFSFYTILLTCFPYSFC